MANPEHLKILEQGVEVWNKWREENPDVCPDLNFSNIERANLKGIKLGGAKLKGVKLEGADLTMADLNGAKLAGANLRDAKLEGANFKWADLEDTNLRGTYLEGANLGGANLGGADLRWTKLTNVNVQGVKFDNNMECRGINVQGCIGSQRFVRHVMDLDYIEETLEKHPIKFSFWWFTSNCGRSIWRWAMLSIFFALGFGYIFSQNPEWFEISTDGIKNSWFTPYYFSIVTFTTLGFGDVTPKTTIGELWLTAEVTLGYIMLGGLITLFATRMVRQSG
ncbi:pentapeptide repeat-containing protein [Maridesulfovibrio sp.]|uniref:pentapeptide repeat-containing protein n=1 Tax=Maridesulfovibrio sp. TaxID=2795000 RepID=UPI002A18A6B4|nr:pentapeptide repeat-containing protein [Maridesulfovibrio sp.]